jgi:hypothetical protein
MDAIRQLLTRLGELAAHPGAFGILIAYAVLWFVFDRESLDSRHHNIDRMVHDAANSARRAPRHASPAGEDGRIVACSCSSGQRND